MSDAFDTGDKAAYSLSHKMNLGNYESFDIYFSATLTKRESESDEDFIERLSNEVENVFDGKIEKAQALIAGREPRKKK